MTSIDLEDVKIKLYNKLKPSGWADVLKTFLLSSDFDKILKELLKQSQNGKRFTPTIKDLFRAFEECPYDKTRVILLGQDPYPYADVPDGIAFSCSKQPYVQPSLKFILNAVRTTVYNDDYYSLDPDLKRWSNQGILMLNTALTTTVGSVGSHVKLWQPFMTFLFDVITWNKNPLIYMFLGAKAREWDKSIPSNNWKFYTDHPASALHNKQEIWDCKDIFNKVNKVLYDTHGEIIEW